MSFFFASIQNQAYLSKTEDAFAQQGLKSGLVREVGGMVCKLYHSESRDFDFLDSAGNSWGMTGTLVYKGKWGVNALQTFSNDFQAQTIDYNQLLGSFALLQFDGNAWTIYLDHANIQHCYYHTGEPIISSSWLAIAQACEGKLSLDKTALAENILSGSLVGPDSPVNEIKRFTGDSLNIHGVSIKAFPKPEVPETRYGRFEEAVANQVRVLNDYFEKISPFAEAMGVDSGITSGMDSRLLLGFIRKHIRNYQVHSHYRKHRDREINIAQQLVDACQLNERYKVEPITYPEDMSTPQFAATMERGFQFFDAHIRMHAFWFQEYNSAGLRRKVLGNKRLGLSGIGGEQYRNMEGIIFPQRSWPEFLEYNVFKNLSGDSVADKDFERQMLKNFQVKTEAILGIPETEKADFKLIKRYLNEVFIQARLGARNNMENKVSWFLSPYTDPTVAHAAYNIINYIGWANDFEMAMIKKIDPQLAAVISDYGYPLNGKTPLKYKLKALARELEPKKARVERLERTVFSRPYAYFETLKTKHDVVNEWVNIAKESGLPLDWKKLLVRPDMMPNVLAAGYLIKRLRDFGKLD